MPLERGGIELEEEPTQSIITDLLGFLNGAFASPIGLVGNMTRGGAFVIHPFCNVGMNSLSL